MTETESLILALERVESALFSLNGDDLANDALVVCGNLLLDVRSTLRPFRAKANQAPPDEEPDSNTLKFVRSFLKDRRFAANKKQVSA